MQRDERKKEVLETALQKFSELGFKKTTVEEISNALGLTKGALYLYAKDKKDLYDQAVKFGFLQWQKRVLEAIQTVTNVEESFIVCCKTAFRYLSEDKVLRRVLVHDPALFPMSFSKDPYKDVNDGSMDMMKDIMDRGIREGVFKPIDTRITTKLLFSIFKMLIIQTYVPGEADAKKMFDVTLENLTRGFFIQK